MHVSRSRYALLQQRYLFCCTISYPPNLIPNTAKSSPQKRCVSLLSIVSAPSQCTTLCVHCWLTDHDRGCYCKMHAEQHFGFLSTSRTRFNCSLWASRGPSWPIVRITLDHEPPCHPNASVGVGFVGDELWPNSRRIWLHPTALAPAPDAVATIKKAPASYLPMPSPSSRSITTFPLRNIKIQSLTQYLPSPFCQSLSQTSAISTMSATHGHNEACCNIPPVISAGYVARSSYEQLGGLKNCEQRPAPGQPLADQPSVQMPLAQLTPRRASSLCTTSSVTLTRRSRAPTSWPVAISSTNTRFPCQTGSKANPFQSSGKVVKHRVETQTRTQCCKVPSRYRREAKSSRGVVRQALTTRRWGCAAGLCEGFASCQPHDNVQGTPRRESHSQR